MKLVSIVAASLLLVAHGASANEVRISGSDTLESLFQNASSQYARSAGAGWKVTQSFKGTTAGLRDLCEGRADIAPASAPMDPDTARRCQANGVEAVEVPLAMDAVVVVAHPARSGLGSLNLDELKAIFHPESSGKVTRWSQVRAGSSDAPLQVASLDPRSGTVAFVTQKLLGLRGFVRTDAKTSSDHAEVLRMVANDPGAVGYVSMGALTESKAAVWRVPVNFGNGPIVPSHEAVLNETYATFSRVLFMYVSRKSLNAKDNPTGDYARWIIERGPKLAAYEGFVPLVSRNYQDGLRKLGPAPTR